MFHFYASSTPISSIKKCEATDIAETVLFLCSDAAGFVTGQTWAVDGGRSLGMKGSD